MKFLNLILYSTDIPEYVEMQKVLEQYLVHSNIEHYFYHYDSSQTEEFLIKGNILSIRGTETFIPGILEKTLQAFKYFQDKEYDYIVRSNISTIVDFYELERHIGSKTLDYGGPLYYIGCLTPQGARIPGSKPFVSGICIVLSRKAVKILVDETKRILNYRAIDDVAIGIHLSSKVLFARPISIDGTNTYVFNSDRSIKGMVVYRNKSNSRNDDVKRMKNLTSQLM